MKRLHLIFGVVVVIVFLLTGQYMEYVHNRLLPDGTRMLYRSRHIYLLLAGLLNLVIGIYFVARPRGWRRKLQIVGSVLIVLSPGLLLAGFFFRTRLGTGANDSGATRHIRGCARNIVACVERTGAKEVKCGFIRTASGSDRV
jgi:hypothetical protein